MIVYLCVCVYARANLPYIGKCKLVLLDCEIYFTESQEFNNSFSAFLSLLSPLLYWSSFENVNFMTPPSPPPKKKKLSNVVKLTCKDEVLSLENLITS